MIYNQEIIPSIANMKDFEWFLGSSFTCCVLMDFHIALLAPMIKRAHADGKKIFIHLDLLHGLSSDEYGCEYACQKLHVDGVISTKSKVIETAKKNKKLAILRLFLIDSKSLEKGIQLCNTLRPDYMEVLPAIAFSVFAEIRARTNTPIMGGGLLKTPEQVRTCLDSGVSAVTISDVRLIQDFMT